MLWLCVCVCFFVLFIHNNILMRAQAEHKNRTHAARDMQKQIVEHNQQQQPHGFGGQLIAYNNKRNIKKKATERRCGKKASRIVKKKEVDPRVRALYTHMWRLYIFHNLIAPGRSSHGLKCTRSQPGTILFYMHAMNYSNSLNDEGRVFFVMLWIFFFVATRWNTHTFMAHNNLCGQLSPLKRCFRKLGYLVKRKITMYRSSTISMYMIFVLIIILVDWPMHESVCKSYCGWKRTLMSVLYN